MEISKLTDQVTDKLTKAISSQLSLEEKHAVSRIVEKALLDATGWTHDTYRDLASKACGPDDDTAHKIQTQMDKKRDTLITNLMSLR